MSSTMYPDDDDEYPTAIKDGEEFCLYCHCSIHDCLCEEEQFLDWDKERSY